MMEVIIAAEFGYVILVVVASFFMLMGLGIRVGMARKKFDVKYPAMYSDKDPLFNCIQRAHQNTLEGYPAFLVFLVLGGLKYPTLCALAGALWIVSRVAYAKGYYTGDPAKRNRGAFGYIGLLTLLGCNISLALSLLGWI